MKLIPMMLVVLLGCAGDAVETGAREPLLGCSERGADELKGCRDAGDACTWCAPVGEACRSDFNSFCARGVGWCDFGTCTAICHERPGTIVKCEAGTHESWSKLETGAALCLCIAD